MGAVPVLTPDSWRRLARSSPWRWRALSFDLRRRPLHGPEHEVRATVVRPGRIVVTSPTGGVDDRLETRPGAEVVGGMRRGASQPPPYAWEVAAELDADGLMRRRDRWGTADDPMWQDYQFVAMLDPVELADASLPPDDAAWVGGDERPPALDLHRLDDTLRQGRPTWWAEVSPRDGYDPRCSCCPLLWGRVSEDVEAAVGGAVMRERRGDLHYPSRYLVALDVATGVCVHVEHLDGTFAGRGFSLDVLAVDDEVVLPSTSGPVPNSRG